MLKANRLKRQKRVRAKIMGTKEKPRLSVFRSNKHFFAQAIDDGEGKTLVSISESEIKEGKTKIEKSKALGLLFAAKLKKSKQNKVVFDKGAFRYHGRVKAFAEGLREGGIQF